ncbi:MAG: HAMP domain-containing histidine kinase [Clostridia bacterium]|nr:HAMP domain-containing histidine kinase [Clostridia bacterium]
MNRLSVKLKITVWYIVAMVIISSVSLVAMLKASNGIIDRDISERITRTVTMASHQLAGPDGRLRTFHIFPFYDQGVHMALYDADGNVVGGQIPYGLPDSNIEFEDDILRSVSYDGSSYKVFDKKISLNDGTVMWLKGIVSVSDESRGISSMAKLIVIMALILIIAAACGGYLIISRAFVPVKKISTTAKQISESSDLSQRINIGNGKDEISNLANTFDTMLDKLETTFEREKQFTSDASHELRTPVAVVLSECEYMTDCAKTEEDCKESVQSVKRQAEKMSKLISELLMISRMDKNTLATEFENVNLSELVEFVCDEQQEIQTKDISLQRSIGQNIVAYCDRFLIMRLIINLMSNAYQYTDDGGCINVELTENEGNVVLSVRDNGIGISEKDISEIWERFYQADPSRTAKDSGNMGLGLSMVKQIAQLHNGSVGVTSKLGEGSTFTFTMPNVK